MFVPGSRSWTGPPAVWCAGGVTEYDSKLAAARARADQQLAHVNGMLDDIVLDRTRRALAVLSPLDAWAALSSYIAKQLDCVGPAKGAAELLAAAAIRIVQAEEFATPPDTPPTASPS